MEHQTESCLFARYTTAQYLRQIKDQSDEVLHPLILTLSTLILKNGSRSENPKEMLTDSRLTYINALLLAINLCASLNKEMQMLDLDGVNCLENEKQLENLISCLKEMLTKTIHNLTKKTD